MQKFLKTIVIPTFSLPKHWIRNKRILNHLKNWTIRLSPFVSHVPRIPKKKRNANLRRFQRVPCHFDFHTILSSWFHCSTNSRVRRLMAFCVWSEHSLKLFSQKVFENEYQSQSQKNLCKNPDECQIFDLVSLELATPSFSPVLFNRNLQWK